MIGNDEKLLKDRLQHILFVKKCPVARLADNETLRARLGRQINGDAAVPYSTIVLFLTMFPDVSADWLMIGEGQMIKSKQKATHVYNKNEVHDSNANGNIYAGCDLKVVPSEDDVDGLKKRIAELEKDKEVLQNVIAAFTASVKK